MPRLRGNSYFNTPQPANSRPARCAALREDGSECTRVLQASHHDFCYQHHSEKQRLYKEYKEAEADFNRQGDPASELSIDVMEGMVQLGQRVVALRDKVNRRFFSKGTENNRGHIQQILKMKNNIDRLENLIASQRRELTNGTPDAGTASATTASRTEGQTIVYRSLFSPDVPMSKLDHLPRDHIFVKTRELLDHIRAIQIEKIYKMFPSLNDSTNFVYDQEQATKREPDKGDLVLRNVFREYLVWTGDTGVLARASETGTIDAFLQHSTEELEGYIKFLEAFNSGRPDTSHFLRDAICDYLLPPDAPGITILGSKVASEPQYRRMGVDGWDILYQYFSQGDTWCFLEQYSVGYEDLLLAKKLASLGRYGGPKDNDPFWLHLEVDVSQECRVALLLGFVAQTKGLSDPQGPISKEVCETEPERQCRNYVAGRMSKNDPLAKKLIDELASRVMRFIFYAYDRETQEVVAGSDSEDSTWITRSRKRCDQGDLADATWKIEWSVKDILNDLGSFRSRRDRMMNRDYYELIIIDRTERPTFDLLDCVAEALMQLSGELSSRGVIVKTVRDIIPSAEQDELLEALLGETNPTAKMSTSFPRLEYEGNRLRAWDIQRNYPDILVNPKERRSWDIRENRTLSGILSSMEAAGVIYRAAKFESPQAIPKLMMAMDGQEDLYFDYSRLTGGKEEFAARVAAAQVGKSTVENTNNPFFCNATLDIDGDGLRQFAETFKAANPNAVFAKGMIYSHYCAWPFPHMSSMPILTRLNFCTPDGHLYKWKQLPFDFPLSFELWQFFLHNEVNCKLPFVRATQTTFVICASTAAEAETNMARMLSVADKMDWRLLIPSAHRWTSELELLDLEVLWKGVQPLAVHSWQHTFGIL